MYDVFISYSRKDRDFVFRVADHLADDNLTCWIDTKDLHPAEVWRNEIKDAIIYADNFLFVISPDSNDFEHCETEIDFAVQHRIGLVPVFYRVLQENKKLQTSMSERQWLKIDRNDEEKDRRVGPRYIIDIT